MLSVGRCHSQSRFMKPGRTRREVRRAPPANRRRELRRRLSGAPVIIAVVRTFFAQATAADAVHLHRSASKSAGVRLSGGATTVFRTRR